MEYQKQQEQALYTEYIQEDILQAAGIYGEKIAIEQIRVEIFELESEVAVAGGELEGMRKKWDGIKRSLRFSLIMLAVFYLLYQLMYRLQVEQIMLYSQAENGTQGEGFILLMLIAAISDFFRILFWGIAQIFLARSIYKLYQFLSNYDSGASRQWCAWIKQKNLCQEIEQCVIRNVGMEDRLRRLRQVRTMYRERKQEEWSDDNLPKRIVMERELEMGNGNSNSSGAS